MNISVQKMHPDATIPKYAKEGDAGFDLSTIEEAVLPAGGRALFRTGLAMKIPKGYVGLIWDRSGLAAKQGLTVLAGVLDSGYRGEISIVLLNTSKDAVSIEKGQRIAQMLLQKVNQATFKEVKKLPASKRGATGFGSSGKK